MNQIICISEKIYRASQWVKDKYKRPTTTVVSFENENGGFRVESTRHFFAQSAETTARISCCELHLVAAKRNSKLYFLQTVMLAYLWHRKSASLIAHSGQLSQWNKVRRMEYSLWTKHTHWRESGQTGAGIPLAVQDEQYGDRQECRHRALTLKPNMFSSWNNLYLHK